MTDFRFVIVALVVFTFSAPAFARSHRIDDVPHATNAMFNPNGGECGLCHARETGGGVRTGFGTAVEINIVDPTDSAAWSMVFSADSDRDGYSNGMELGDPDGLFTMGDSDPLGTIYDPNDASSNPCGDGILQDVEACEVDEDLTETCDDLGFGPGVVVCTRCRVDPGGCEGANAVNNLNNQNNVDPNDQNNAVNNQNNDTNTNNTNGGNDVNEDDAGGCTTSKPGFSSSIWLILIVLVFAGLPKRLFA